MVCTHERWKNHKLSPATVCRIIPFLLFPSRNPIPRILCNNPPLLASIFVSEAVRVHLYVHMHFFSPTRPPFFLPMRRAMSVCCSCCRAYVASPTKTNRLDAPILGYHGPASQNFRSCREKKRKRERRERKENRHRAPYSDARRVCIQRYGRDEALRKKKKKKNPPNENTAGEAMRPMRQV